jgi:hypothetical protein
MSKGIIYLVSGGRSYLGELMTSLESLRRVESTLPVTVFSRFELPRRAKADFKKIESNDHPLKLKVQVLRQSPYEQTLFLDTDTSIRKPIAQLFGELETYDFCVANSHDADWSVNPPRFLNMVKQRDYNTGVLVYKKASPPMRRFLDRWEEAVRGQDPADMWAGHNCDQHHFNKLVTAGTLEECGVAFKELDNIIYNCRGAMYDAVMKLGRADDIHIFHHRTRSMKLRKLLYSISNPQTTREFFRKATARIRAF